MNSVSDTAQGEVRDDQQVKDPLLVPEGPITRSRAKKIKEAMLGLAKETMADIANISVKALTLKMGLSQEEPSMVNIIQAIGDVD